MRHILRMLVAGICVVCIAYVLVYPDMQARSSNARANNFMHTGMHDEAWEAYTDATHASTKLGFIPEGNRSALAYLSEDYTQAYDDIVHALKTGCRIDLTATHEVRSMKESDTCATLAYTAGNILYRLGEQVEQRSATSTSVVSERDALWMQAIGAYQRTLAARPHDVFAQENIDFILAKLNGHSSNEEEHSNDGTEDGGEEGQQQQQQDDIGTQPSGEQGTEEADKEDEGTDTGTGEQQGSKQNGGEEEGQQQGDTGTQSSGEQGTEEADKESEGADTGVREGQQQDAGLDAAANKQLDEYMKQIDQKSSAMQQQFNQNPDAQQQSSNNPFDNPFFDQFLEGTPFAGEFSNNGQTIDKDW